MNKKVLTKAPQAEELSFEELYKNIATDWQKKAADLRMRKWRELKQKTV